MTNILEAIVNIAANPLSDLKALYSGRNRVNNIGEALETFIKDAFANVIHIDSQIEKMERYNQLFSWTGTQNHPPDIMIKGGDAIEVKKIQSSINNIALNSSYPKSTLRSDNVMITKGCKNCEEWTEKDLIYCIGHTTDNSIKSLWMVYGNIYAADHEIYQVVKEKITVGINEIPNIELTETNELGKIRSVDPLGITSLRIRGMWHMQNPKKVYDYLYTPSSNSFELIAIIPETKYISFPKESIDKIENLKNPELKITDVKVKNPNIPVKLIPAKFISYKIPLKLT
ncbi:NgoPII family restriction endonuclease [Flavobacterium microcysteis]